MERTLVILFQMLKSVKKNPKLYIIVALIIVCLFEYKIIVDDKNRIEELRIAYQNPQVKEVVKTVKVNGPVRIVYRKTIEKVPGEKEIVEKIVYRDSGITVKESGKDSIPIIPESVIDNQNRWLVGISKTGFRKTDDKYVSALAGYSFYNRLDLLCGASIERKPVISVQAVGRF